VHYDAENQRLTVEVNYEPLPGASRDAKGLDADFMGNPLPSAEQRKAGPFQDLQAGENVFDVWDGLPLLAPGELPPVDWTK